MNENIIPWNPAVAQTVELNLEKPQKTLKLANGIKENELEMLSKAIKGELYQMAAEFIWKKGMVQLTKVLSSFGAKFIGEMLDRTDIPENGNLENHVTHHDCIFLAGELGLIDGTGAIRLKHNLDLLQHFDDPNSIGEYKKSELISIIENSIQYVLQHSTSESANIDFKIFRDKLLSETLTAESSEIKILLASPYFFQKTATKILLNGLRGSVGAKKQHILININCIIPSVWPQLSEEDRFSVGRAYSEFSSEGDPESVKVLRMTLGQVSGFDYVPENVRSNTFRRTALDVVSAHNSFNNFYLEVLPTKELSKLGTIIPKPALAECMRAYLCVYLGNAYGNSWEAASIAQTELKKIPLDNWEYYVTKVLISDKNVLWELRHSKPASRLIAMNDEIKFSDKCKVHSSSGIHDLLAAIKDGSVGRIVKSAEFLVDKLLAIK